jgi:hypothetical protein
MVSLLLPLVEPTVKNDKAATGRRVAGRLQELAERVNVKLKRHAPNYAIFSIAYDYGN